MIKQLKEQWDSYVGPKDERLVAEENRLYAKLARALLVIGLVSVFYGNALHRAAGMFGDPAIKGKLYGAFPSEMVLCIGIIIVCTWYTSSLTKQGVISDNRFAEVDSFPAGYFALCSALGALAAFVGAFVVEALAQAQFAGFGGVYWAANAAMAAIFAIVVFVACMVGFWLYFRDAKRNRRRIEAELGE